MSMQLNVHSCKSSRVVRTPTIRNHLDVWSLYARKIARAHLVLQLRVLGPKVKMFRVIKFGR